MQASVLMAQALVEQLHCLLPAIEWMDQAIQKLFAQHPDQELFCRFPGAGEALAPRLLAALGSDRHRYQDAAEIQCFSGVALVIERSGKSCWVHWRIACPQERALRLFRNLMEAEI